ncbi:hypothetical protein [Streptomyces sp. XD-27]|uniref:hypothetical protein n=1 Tax=Streptomyces sp. XD-27 TaxID=3062779 RepID=UPI0026F4255E|nr:hypothetical protein [Streptomyces sp. XD-27]WKX71203.1 hypothetical protein Q3Y56_15935 [Streptomyces sp. XD-27]
MTELLAELERFDRIGLSRVAGHGAACCHMVRHGVFARLTQFGDIGARLAAVPELFRWGPVQWPAYWCHLALHDGLIGDCGVHADVAAALLERDGIPHARGRAALLTGPLAPAHWRVSWNEAQANVAWIGRNVVHHEVIRVGDRWWDPSDARWFAGAGGNLAGARVVAVREDDGPWQFDPGTSTPAPTPLPAPASTLAPDASSMLAPDTSAMLSPDASSTLSPDASSESSSAPSSAPTSAPSSTPHVLS